MRVLVVEDERPLASAIRQGLEVEGFVVDLAFDGKEGLRLATERAYDAVVLDIMLPGMNGYRVCAELRSAGIWTPVLMLTAKDGEERSEAMQLASLVRRGAPTDELDLASEDHLTQVVDASGLVRSASLRDRARVEVDVSRVSGARISGDRDELIQVVADDGPGIPAADRERVFERFTRLDESRSRGRGGAGLGLAIVRQIVEAHGGTITVADQHPGARFTVRLPAEGA